MTLSILNRLALRGERQSSQLNSVQQEFDRTLDTFSQEALNWKSLASMTLGGVAYRYGRLTAIRLLGNGANAIPLLSKAFSHLTGLATEVTVFETSQRSLESLTAKQPNSALWKLEGKEGLLKSWSRSFVNFGSLRIFGKIAEGTNPFLRHFIQDTGMVFGEHLVSQLELADKTQGSLLQQFLHAETVNTQMAAGLSFLHFASAGRIHHIENHLDLELSSYSYRVQRSLSHPLLGVQTLSVLYSDAVTQDKASRVPKSFSVNEAAAKLAWSEAFRGKKILERNDGIIHDVGKVLTTPLMQASMLDLKVSRIKLATSGGSEELSEFHDAIHTLHTRLQQISRIFHTGKDNVTKIREDAGSAETIAKTVQQDSDNTLMTLSEIIALFPETNVRYLHCRLVLDRNPSLQASELATPLLKIGPLLEKAEAFIQDQQRILFGNNGPAIVSLAAVIEEAWVFSETERELSQIEDAHFEIPATEVYLHVNQYTLMASLLNLIVNACHAMRESSTRRLSVQSKLHSLEDGDYVSIEVTDSGSGITEELKDRIFEPYFTTKPRAHEVSPDNAHKPLGTGMGLFMVSEMIQKYGGKIVLETSVGKGSTFKIYLPKFDPLVGIEATAFAEGDLHREREEGLLGRIYPQIPFESACILLREIVERHITLAPDEKLENPQNRGKLLAAATKSVLSNRPYPDCVRELYEIQRILELAYVHFDFEMLEAYRKELDPDTERYMNILIALANKKSKLEDHVHSLDEMPLDLPGGRTIPRIDHVRINFTTQFERATSRTVSETREFLTTEASATMALAFINTFKNRIGVLKLYQQLLQKRVPGITLSDVLDPNSNDPRIAPLPKSTILKVLQEAKEYKRIFTESSGIYHEQFLQNAFYYEGYNLYADYSLLYDSIQSLPPALRQSLEIEEIPAPEVVIAQIPPEKRQAPSKKAN